MSEFAAMLRDENAELRAELTRWKNRVRELEDAILIHDRDTTKPTERDHDLYGRMGELWT